MARLAKLAVCPENCLVSSQDRDSPCWCGNVEFEAYNIDYYQCAACGTLAAKHSRTGCYEVVVDERSDFYGKRYWFEHQTEELKLPDLEVRAKTDFLDRYPHWLNIVYGLGLRGGKTLEIGCGHGGFVYLLRSMGFDASGLELSPWLAGFARGRYGIPMYSGPLRNQVLARGSFDLILLFDVLEHAAKPLDLIEQCRSLLKEGGHILLQTPCLPDQMDLDRIRDGVHPFMRMLLPAEHLFLFSKQSLYQLLRKAGFEDICRHPSVFEIYDITCSAVAGMIELPTQTPNRVSDIPPVATALINLFEKSRDLETKLSRTQKDADDRLLLLEGTVHRMKQLQKDADDRLRDVELLTNEIARLNNLLFQVKEEIPVSHVATPPAE